MLISIFGMRGSPSLRRSTIISRTRSGLIASPRSTIPRRISATRSSLSSACAYRKSHLTFRRLHLQDLHPDTTHRLSNLDFTILLLVYGSLPSSLFHCSLLFCASP